MSIYGAKYETDPKNESDKVAFLANPKSANFKCPVLSTKILEIFKSLYKNPLLWSFSRANATSHE